MSSEYRYLGGYFPGLTDVCAAALAGVFAFGVFTNDDPVEGGGFVGDGGQGWGYAAEDAGGADVGVVLEGLDEGEAEGPEGDVVGYVFV